MDTFGNPMAVPLDAIEDKTEEDQSSEDANLDFYPEAAVEEPEAYNQRFYPDFLDQDALNSIVHLHGQILFRPFDHEGWKVCIWKWIR